MYTIRKEFKFEAAHVLNTSESKECRRIHGHSYRVEVFLSRMDLNSDGMVEDFKMVKEAFKPVIDELDHALVVKESAYSTAFKNRNEKVIIFGKNPTAENMAEFIYDFANKEILSDEVFIDSIRVHETDSGYAEFKPDLPYTLEEQIEENTNNKFDLTTKYNMLSDVLQIINEVETSKDAAPGYRAGAYSSTIPLNAEGYVRIKKRLETYISQK